MCKSLDEEGRLPQESVLSWGFGGVRPMKGKRDKSLVA